MQTQTCDAMMHCLLCVCLQVPLLRAKPRWADCGPAGALAVFGLHHPTVCCTRTRCVIVRGWSSDSVAVAIYRRALLSPPRSQDFKFQLGTVLVLDAGLPKSAAACQPMCGRVCRCLVCRLQVPYCCG